MSSDIVCITCCCTQSIIYDVHRSTSNNLIVALNNFSPYSLHRLNNTYTLVCTESLAYRSNNFIVGLTNVSPLISTPTLWNYTLCGQYPGAVPAGATVSLYCPYNLPPFRYVIVLFPRTGHMNFCELEVLAPGTFLRHMSFLLS